jgi:hypothetical protein
MSTILDRPVTDTVAVTTPAQSPSREPAVYETYVPDSPEAPRPARRIAMRARREQERRLGGW